MTAYERSRSRDAAAWAEFLAIRGVGELVTEEGNPRDYSVWHIARHGVPPVQRVRGAWIYWKRTEPTDDGTGDARVVFTVDDGRDSSDLGKHADAIRQWLGGRRVTGPTPHGRGDLVLIVSDLAEAPVPEPAFPTEETVYSPGISPDFRWKHYEFGGKRFTRDELAGRVPIRARAADIDTFERRRRLK